MSDQVVICHHHRVGGIFFQVNEFLELTRMTANERYFNYMHAKNYLNESNTASCSDLAFHSSKDSEIWHKKQMKQPILWQVCK